MSVFSHKQKHYVVLVLMITVALMISSIDIYIPAMPYLTTYFEVSEFYMQLTIMITPLVSVVAALPIGRMADLKGRRFLLIGGCFLFSVGSFLCGAACSYLVFFEGRLIQALGNTTVSVISLTILADLFKGVEYARYVAIYVSIFPLMFAVAPVVGAYLFEWFGWQFSFIFLGISAVGTLIFFLTTLKETKIKEVSPFVSPKFLTAAYSLIKMPSFLVYVLGHTLPICISSIFLANAAFIFIQNFGFSPSLFALVQAIPILCNFVSALIYRKWIPNLGLNAALQLGIMGFCFFCVLCAFMTLDWIPSTPFTILSLLTIANIFMPYLIATCSTRLFDLELYHKGLAVALVSVFRNIGLVLAIGCSSFFYDGTIYPVLVGMLGVSVLLCFILWPYLFKEKRVIDRKIEPIS